MKVIKAEELLSVRTERGHYVFGSDLAEESAQAAARVLAEHWEDAMQFGESLHHMLSDIDEVAEVLLKWKRVLETTFKEPAQLP